MIEDRLHKAIIQRLAENDYFLRPPAILVVAQEEPDGDAEDDGEGGEAISERVDPSKAIQTALNTTGLCVEVLVPDWERARGGITTFEGLVHICERRIQNRKTTGNRRRGRNVARVVASLLDQFAPALDGERIEELGNTWLTVTGKQFIGAIEGDGLWEVRYELQTRIENMAEFLADEDAFAIVDENQTSLAGETVP